MKSSVIIMIIHSFIHSLTPSVSPLQSCFARLAGLPACLPACLLRPVSPLISHPVISLWLFGQRGARCYHCRHDLMTSYPTPPNPHGCMPMIIWCDHACTISGDQMMIGRQAGRQAMAGPPRKQLLPRVDTKILSSHLKLKYMYIKSIL
jgi:hypothetical protein